MEVGCIGEVDGGIFPTFLGMEASYTEKYRRKSTGNMRKHGKIMLSIMVKLEEMQINLCPS